MKDAILQYRNAVKSLEDLKANELPRGARVLVNHERYSGEGVVATDSECPPDQVAVLLPNGNVWRYPLESVRAINFIFVSHGGQIDTQSSLQAFAEAHGVKLAPEK